MKQAARESLDAYYREADSWADDRQDMLRASRRTAWIVAGVAVAIALFEAIALIVLMPLKTVVPYTLLVDKQTGYVQELKPLDAEKIAPDTALTQSFLVQYVIARESYDAGTVQANYRKVQTWSAQVAKADYVNGMQAANPASPLSRYPRSVVDTRQEHHLDGRQRSVGAVRHRASRSGWAGAAGRILGRGDQISLLDRADARRGPLHQSARLPGVRL